MQPTQYAVTHPPVDPSIITLSTGVQVRFHKLARNISNMLVTNMIQESQLDDKGEIRENLTVPEQLNLAKKMQDYNTAIIRMGGVELISPLPEDTGWLKRLKKAGMLNDGEWDLEDKDDVESIFLLFMGFVSEEDNQLLSENATAV